VNTIKFKNTQRKEQQDQKASAAANPIAPLRAKRRAKDDDEMLDTTSQTGKDLVLC
jgi:hypothetical protein